MTLDGRGARVAGAGADAGSACSRARSAPRCATHGGAARTRRLRARCTRARCRSSLTRPALAVAAGASLLAAFAVGDLLLARHRASCRGRRGRLRRSTTSRRRDGARGDRRARARRWKRCSTQRRTSPPTRAAPARSSGLFATQQNSGDILVRLKPRGDATARPTRSSRSSATSCSEAVPDMEIEFVQLLQDMIGDLEGNPTPIEVKIFGDDPDVLAELAATQVEDVLEDVRGVVDVVGVQRGNPEVDVADRSGGRRPRSGSRSSRSRRSSRRAGSARSPPICGWQTAPFRCACGFRTPTVRSRAADADAPSAAPRAGRAPLRGARHVERVERPERAAAREPAADGARHRAPRGPRPRQRGRRADRRAART